MEYPRADIARSIGNPDRVLFEDFVVPSSREDYYSESIVSHAVKKFSSLSEVWQVGGCHENEAPLAGQGLISMVQNDLPNAEKNKV